MTENTRNTYASHTLEILKRAVLEVLYEGTDVAPIRGASYIVVASWKQVKFANNWGYRSRNT